MKIINRSMIFGVLLLMATGCAPEVGSEAWCKQMDKSPKTDWSLNDASAYAKNCIFRKAEEEGE